MITHRTIRYRLHPQTRAKHHKLAGTAGACRFVWNHFTGKLRDEYQEWGVSYFHFYALVPKFTLLRKYTKPWLKEYSANIVREALKPIQTNYKEFFKGKGGLPRFKKRERANDSFPLVSGTFKVNGKHLHIARIGEVLILGNNPYPEGKAVSGTVKRECGDWYAYIVYEVEIASKPRALKEVGIDRNCGQVSLSDGTVYHIKNPQQERLEARARRYQRMMARRDAGSRKAKRDPSKRYMRVKCLYQSTRARLTHHTNNKLHHISKEIAGKYSLVYLENLNVKGMTASAKGTAETPGKNVKAKSGLNKSILKTNWHKLEQYLNYKTNIVKVPAAFTSQRCNKCGHIDKENRKTQADFKCLACGYRDNADVNAALNILASGNGATGRGDGEVTRSMKRQCCTVDLSI